MYRSQYVREIKIFRQTRYLAQTEFKNETQKMLAGTKFYKDPSQLKVDQWEPCDNILFIKGGSVDTAYKYAGKTDNVAVLNFADAIIPGGCVEYGAPTQEENMCRCTTLYESLVNCNEYYYQNSLARDCVYSNGLIYSPDVVAFRDDVTYVRKRPRTFDVMTCPSPATDVSEKVLVRRIEGIIKAAIDNGVKTIILGAWGCGAFGQDPLVMGKCFAKVLNKYNAFDKVVFAIRATSGNWGEENKSLFEIGFKENYIPMCK